MKTNNTDNFLPGGPPEGPFGGGGGADGPGGQGAAREEPRLRAAQATACRRTTSRPTSSGTAPLFVLVLVLLDSMLGLSFL